MKGIIEHILLFLIEHATLNIRTGDQPEGHRVGGHDIPQLKDKFVVMTIGEAGLADFTGYWQYE